MSSQLTLTKLGAFPIPGSRLRAIAPVPLRGDSIFCDRGGRVYQADPADSTEPRLLAELTPARMLACSPDGRSTAAADGRVLRGLNRGVPGTFRADLADRVDSLAWDGASDRFAVLAGQQLLAVDGGGGQEPLAVLPKHGTRRRWFRRPERRLNVTDRTGSLVVTDGSDRCVAVVDGKVESVGLPAAGFCAGADQNGHPAIFCAGRVDGQQIAVVCDFGPVEAARVELPGAVRDIITTPAGSRALIILEGGNALLWQPGGELVPVPADGPVIMAAFALGGLEVQVVTPGNVIRLNVGGVEDADIAKLSLRSTNSCRSAEAVFMVVRTSEANLRANMEHNRALHDADLRVRDEIAAAEQEVKSMEGEVSGQQAAAGTAREREHCDCMLALLHGIGAHLSKLKFNAEMNIACDEEDRRLLEKLGKSKRGLELLLGAMLSIKPAEALRERTLRQGKPILPPDVGRLAIALLKDQVNHSRFLAARSCVDDGRGYLALESASTDELRRIGLAEQISAARDEKEAAERALVLVQDSLKRKAEEAERRKAELRTAEEKLRDAEAMNQLLERQKRDLDAELAEAEKAGSASAAELEAIRGKRTKIEEAAKTLKQALDEEEARRRAAEEQVLGLGARLREAAPSSQNG